ncbi:MAG: hypothetical protein H7X70_05275 [Candidatus Kapabacteria bacterium]|nr:hypothetical protein [Candidatus Kapabacteria bacterium]
MNFKTIIAIILSLAIGYIVLKVLWWIVRNVFSLALDLMGLVLIAMIAVPIYIIIRKKLLTR